MSISFRDLLKNQTYFHSVLFAGIGLLFAVVGMVSFLAAPDFETQGATVDGTVQAVWKQLSNDDNGSQDVQYMVRYSFDATFGSPVQATQPVDRTTFEGLVEGGPIAVQYLRDDPETNRPVSQLNTSFDALMAVPLGVMFAAIGWVLIRRSYPTAARLAVLHHQGVPAKATILELRRTGEKGGRSSRSSGGHPYDRDRGLYRLVYEYNAPDGTKMTGESQSYRKMFFGALQPEPGQEIDIKLDIENPASSAWIRDLDVYK